MLRVVSLHRFPVKLMGGQSLPQARIERRGIAGDRRWMMVTPEGRFLTRRELPAMAQLHAAPTERGVVLSRSGMPDCVVDCPQDGPLREVKVWGDMVAARDAGAAAGDWLTCAMGRPVGLVHMPDNVERPVDPGIAREGDLVGFADAYPLLVTLVESLDARLRHPVTMARFRPNIVLAGAPAFSEDSWSSMRIGALTLRVVKPCTRCIVTTQDPDSGAIVDGTEPLRTLRKMGRLMGRETIFGQNAVPDGAGEVAVGDDVEIEVG